MEDKVKKQESAAIECYDALRGAAVSLDIAKYDDIGPELSELIASASASVQEEAEIFAHFAAQLRAPIYEAEDKSSRESIDVSDDHLFAVYDIRSITKRAKRKWYLPASKMGTRTGSRRLTKKRGICVHGTAVSGGFGIHDSRLNLYKDREVDWSNWPQGPDPRHIPERELHILWSRAMALSHRYWGDKPSEYNTGVPYHAISGANSVLYLNLDFDWVTWHGDGSNNDFLGYALDFHSRKDSIVPEDGAKYHPEDLKNDLLYLIDLAREENHEIAEITCHCAWTNKPFDPGKSYIEQVLIPVAEKSGCFIDYGFKASGGKSIEQVLAA